MAKSSRAASLIGGASQSGAIHAEKQKMKNSAAV
jgi:hypothetical protein